MAEGLKPLTREQINEVFREQRITFMVPDDSGHYAWTTMNTDTLEKLVRAVERAHQNRPVRCSNCGASPVAIGEYEAEGDAFCSQECYDQHEELGCPMGTHSGYRHPQESARLIAAEWVLRDLAAYLGNGGYNAPEVDAAIFKEKIMDGINRLSPTPSTTHPMCEE